MRLSAAGPFAGIGAVAVLRSDQPGFQVALPGRCQRQLVIGESVEQVHGGFHDPLRTPERLIATLNGVDEWAQDS